MTNDEINRLSDVELLELIGRKQHLQDLDEFKKKFRNATVAITGSAGTIGSRLAKVLLQSFKIKKLICIDWWENGTFALQEELKEYPNVIYKIADVKNSIRMESIFKQYLPNIVFHASAYKHVPLMEDNPTEAFSNNIKGVLNVAKFASVYGARNFIYISTDKAVNSGNVMGATKRIGEMIVKQMANNYENTKFTIVRFGNVIQSNGSVLSTFKRQILGNKKLTVTDKEVTRYFMTIEEAVHLIISTMKCGYSGNTLLLDMGKPVKIYDIADKLDKLRDKPVGIELIGLRKGEKMSEQLDFDEKKMYKTKNDKVFIIKDNPESTWDIIDWSNHILRIIDKGMSDKDLVDELINYKFIICQQKPMY